MLPRLLFFVGTRPEIIKAAPLFHTLRKSSSVQVDLVHTGQHYDWNMSGIFIEELGLPTPLYHLGVGSGSQPYQIYKIIEKTEEVAGTYLPDAILAVGDTNSTLATAIMASKMDIPFVHIESGLRSFDQTMPEEINRKVADHIASLNFVPTERAASNLLNEGCSPERTFVTGNTVVDALLRTLPRARAESNILKKLKVDPSKFLMTVTVHRRENADNPERLESIVNALIELKEVQIVWPLHPRTKENMEKTGLLKSLYTAKHIKITDPLSYLDFLKLLDNSTVLATDSGGVQEEAATLKIPCVVLRDSTERPEIIDEGIGVMAGVDPLKIERCVSDFLYNSALVERVKSAPNPFGDGTASVKISEVLLNWLEEEKIALTPPKFDSGAPVYTSFIVNKELSGRTVKETEGDLVKIISIYEKDGSFVRPYPDLTLKSRQIIRVLGEKPSINDFKKLWGL